MDNEELLQKMRAARFIENNGRVMRTINILCHERKQLLDIRFELLYINPEGRHKTQFYAAGEKIPVFGQTPGSLKNSATIFLMSL